MSSRSRTLTIGLCILAVALAVAAAVPVPLVALGPGPTFNTLGEVNGRPVVSISGRQTYPTTGHLNMTTVLVTDGLHTADAVRYWFDPQRQLVPRAVVYPPNESDENVQKQNTQQFTDSELNAETAALTYLHQPVDVFIAWVDPKAPSAAALRVGDRLLSVNGQQVTGPAQVTQILLGTRPDNRIPVTLQRGDAPPAQQDVTVGVRPPGPGGGPDGPQGYLGIVAGARPLDPEQIKIQLDDVGGPSAGLMFTLAVIDQLTPGALTNGAFIAGTGTIAATGAVGPISGIPLKMIGARSAGAKVFLVPADNCQEAASADHAGLTLVKVTDLADAMKGLDDLRLGRTPAGC